MRRQNGKKLRGLIIDLAITGDQNPECHCKRTRKDRQVLRFMNRIGESLEIKGCNGLCGGWRTWYYILKFEILHKEN